MLDDESKRRGTLGQLQRNEGRHSLGQAVFHGKRGRTAPTLPGRAGGSTGSAGARSQQDRALEHDLYRSGPGAVTKKGFPMRDEDVAGLSPLLHEHINMLGRYSFAMPDIVARGGLRPLRQPDDPSV